MSSAAIGRTRKFTAVLDQSLRLRYQQGGGCWHLRSCVNNGETGIAFPVEGSFISP
jgi:hypothetical protein